MISRIDAKVISLFQIKVTLETYNKYELIPDFLPENGYLKNSGGGGGLQPPSPMGRLFHLM